MEKRILLAFVLSLVVLYGARAFFGPNPASPAREPTAPEHTVPETNPTPSIPISQVPTSSEVKDDDLQADRAEDVLVDMPLYSALFSNHGGVLKSFRLKTYRDAEGKPIELIDSAGAGKLGWPLSIVTADPKLDETVQSANFTVSRESTRLTMVYAAGGVRVSKILTFNPDRYDFVMETSLTRQAQTVPASLVWQGGFGDQSIPQDASKRQIVYPNGSSYKKEAVSSLKPQEATLAAIGVEDQYFLAMLLFPGGEPVKIRKEEYTGSNSKTKVATSVFSAPAVSPVRVYVGPKDKTALAKTDPALVAVIDYGFFEVIAKPLTLALLWVHSYIGNFGWSIIVLTLLINLVMFPLRLKQQVSMQKMQKIQPQMKTLQDRYKKLKPNDPKRLEIQNQMMNIYKEHGINPMSGCLPLLLQMPFFFAFYKMLQVSIELRQAPWILWIRDLSQMDPYYILPILMAVTMVVSQKMTPATVDPAQARMMMVMPIMFAVLFLWAQSGLVLYWLTSNIVGIGQQYVINKYWPQDAKNKGERLRKRTEREE